MKTERLIEENKQKAEWRKNNPELMDIYRKRWVKKNPWISHHNKAKQRCTNPKEAYYEKYGGRGIKFLMTLKDFKHLWFRDKAHDMKCPSIDRIENDGHYELSNCQYMERSENGSKGHKGVKHDKEFPRKHKPLARINA